MKLQTGFFRTEEREYTEYAYFEKRYINTCIMGNQTVMEIIGFTHYVSDSGISKYTAVTDCAFANVEGETVLVLDMRSDKREKSSLLIADMRKSEKMVRIGLLIGNREDFFSRIYSFERYCAVNN